MTMAGTAELTRTETTAAPAPSSAGQTAVPAFNAAELGNLLREFVGDAPAWSYDDRLTDGSFFGWIQGPVKHSRGCARPVRLVGTSTTVNARTGAVIEHTDTEKLPGQALYKPCGTRLASLCEACADTYRYDTYHLIRAGMAGGKNVPESVARHPAVFATLTAPSFGPVHTAVADVDGSPRPCRARRDNPTCPHGQALHCHRRHRPGDRVAGTPFCLDCYDHDHQVMWNHHAPKLWARTVDRLVRAIAKTARAHGEPFHPVTYVDAEGNTRIRWVCPLRLSYAKVAELQARGALHFHALLRLDGYDPDNPRAILPPPEWATADLLAQLLADAAAQTAVVTSPHRENLDGWEIRWGAQVDTRTVRDRIAGDDQLTEAHVAGYLAKYSTKSTETMGGAVPRLTGGTVDLYAEPTTHRGRLIAAAWRLGHPDTGPAYARLRPKAHMIGFAGHFSTKSHRYSTTLGALRAARRPTSRGGCRVITPDTYDRGDWQHRADGLDEGPADADPDGEETVLVLHHNLTYVGTGWHTSADAELAIGSAAHARAQRAERLRNRSAS